ncbi:MAG TPA: chemical-damaging agent resistance protein C, partial [Leucothrix sp.]|nr:chemical-damaging agent resistance protein C [Leucothrix sp.]
KEIAKYELDEDFSTETAIEFGRLYKKDGSWRFKAVGTGYSAGLQGFVDKYASKFI